MSIGKPYTPHSLLWRKVRNKKDSNTLQFRAVVTAGFVLTLGYERDFLDELILYRADEVKLNNHEKTQKAFIRWYLKNEKISRQEESPEFTPFTETDGINTVKWEIVPSERIFFKSIEPFF